MGPDELEDMANQQFILGVRNNVMREKLIVYRPKNLRGDRIRTPSGGSKSDRSLRGKL